MEQVMSLFPRVSIEETMWNSYCELLKHIASKPNQCQENEKEKDHGFFSLTRTAESLVEYMNRFEADIFKLEYNSEKGPHPQYYDVSEVIRDMTETRFKERMFENLSSEDPKQQYDKIVWNLIQDIKRPLKRILAQEHVFPYETKELLNFIESAKQHQVKETGLDYLL